MWAAAFSAHDGGFQFKLYFDNLIIMEIINACMAFGALAQESRLAVLKRLIATGPRGMPAGEIAAQLDISAPTLSFHLKELKRAGLICAQRRGRNVIYAAEYGGVRALIDFLLADCCGGDRRLCGPYVIEESAA
jgi:DNA-binding transcriptional ArsR family regulator